ELRRARRLGDHAAAAIGVAAQHARLADPPGVARIAEREEVAEARRALPAALGGEPGDAKRREQRIAVGREARLEARIEAVRVRPPPPRRRDRNHVPARLPVRRRARDPALEEAAFECARRVDEEHDAAPALGGPARLVLHRRVRGRDRHRAGILANSTAAVEGRRAGRLSCRVMRAELTREIDESPGGPRVAAFFDVDGTLIAGFSAVAFLRDRLVNGRMTAVELVRALVSTARFQMGALGFSGLIAATAAWLRNVPETELEELAERIFDRDLAAAIYPESFAIVGAHRRRGHTLALVSSATRYQVEPLARALDVPHVLCTRLEVADGRLTGRHVSPTCWGEGKATAAAELARTHDVELGASWFYTDSSDDL